VSSGQFDVARRGLAVLRSMRAIGGKLAQAADFADPALVPPEGEDLLAELRAGAPEPIGFNRIERELRSAWGGKVARHLADIDPEPAAMASAGQVHRAELADDGREVAVKVLHPGAEEALRADLGNLTLLAQLATTVVPGLDVRAITAELRERALEEFDLEFEAQSQRGFARAYRGHPFVHVPAPVTELCRTTVLVSEWLDDGTPYAAVVDGAADSDRYGEALARFHLGAMLHTGAFHADPHPGNHRLLDDGRLAFVDFGAVGRAEPVWLAALLDLADAAQAGDADLVKLDLAGLGYLAEPERVDGERWLAAGLAVGGWLLDPDPTGAITIEPELGERLARERPFDEELLQEALRFGRLPARDLQAGRMLSGLGAMLARLRATAPWGAIAAEYRHGAEPGTDLGRAEAAFWGSRGRKRAEAVSALRR
jgi:predicted unusual protein kinase regulating ubiquinone biosynthesis (AarF/ABC1/UbiB family)